MHRQLEIETLFFGRTRLNRLKSINCNELGGRTGPWTVGDSAPEVVTGGRGPPAPRLLPRPDRRAAGPGAILAPIARRGGTPLREPT